MKTFNSSALSHKRAEVIEAAREGGAVIQVKETSGKVREEFVLVPKASMVRIPVVDQKGKESVLTAVVVEVKGVGHE